MRIKCKKTEQLTVIPELSTEDLNFVNDFLNKLGLNYSEIDEQGLCVDFKIYGTAVSVVKHLKRVKGFYISYLSENIYGWIAVKQSLRELKDFQQANANFNKLRRLLPHTKILIKSIHITENWNRHTFVLCLRYRDFVPPQLQNEPHKSNFFVFGTDLKVVSEDREIVYATEKELADHKRFFNRFVNFNHLILPKKNRARVYQKEFIEVGLNPNEAQDLCAYCNKLRKLFQIAVLAKKELERLIDGENINSITIWGESIPTVSSKGKPRTKQLWHFYNKAQSKLPFADMSEDSWQAMKKLFSIIPYIIIHKIYVPPKLKLKYQDRDFLEECYAVTINHELKAQTTYTIALSLYDLDWFKILYDDYAQELRKKALDLGFDFKDPALLPIEIRQVSYQSESAGSDEDPNTPLEEGLFN